MLISKILNLLALTLIRNTETEFWRNEKMVYSLPRKGGNSRLLSQDLQGKYRLSNLEWCPRIQSGENRGAPLQVRNSFERKETSLAHHSGFLWMSI